ncbi:MAG: glycosyltransferase family 2 protein [Cyclobacteriaceae bacterium]|nr:glycosyltransferase family 2 protein [Cyclobacteriaceae bacterium]
MIDKSPLVTVICLCYNHQRFVEEAIQSVLNQTYSNIQLIVMDDASQDKSIKAIQEAIEGIDNIQFIRNSQNLGNCSAFNKALKEAKGEFVIDLAADDLLLPTRVELGVAAFRNHSDLCGVNFTNAEIINEKGGHVRFHYKEGESVPQGNIFKILLHKYVICPPTIMVKKEVYLELSGYDETLSYEDFDFWIRSSRNWKYCFTNAVLVKKRQVEKSLGSRQYVKGSKQMETTFMVCEKAFHLCRNKTEWYALQKRLLYETKYAIWFLNVPLVLKYLRLIMKTMHSFFFRRNFK